MNHLTRFVKHFLFFDRNEDPNDDPNDASNDAADSVNYQPNNGRDSFLTCIFAGSNSFSEC